MRTEHVFVTRSALLTSGSQWLCSTKRCTRLPRSSHSLRQIAQQLGPCLETQGMTDAASVRAASEKVSDLSAPQTTTLDVKIADPKVRNFIKKAALTDATFGVSGRRNGSPRHATDAPEAAARSRRGFCKGLPEPCSSFLSETCRLWQRRRRQPLPLRPVHVMD